MKGTIRVNFEIEGDNLSPIYSTLRGMIEDYNEYYSNIKLHYDEDNWCEILEEENNNNTTEDMPVRDTQAAENNDPIIIKLPEGTNLTKYEPPEHTSECC